MTISYFKEVFKADPSVDHSRVTRLFQERVTEQMNAELCKEFTDEEICDALFQIGPLKAPGLDGFPACFIRGTGAHLKRTS